MLESFHVLHKIYIHMIEASSSQNANNSFLEQWCFTVCWRNECERDIICISLYKSGEDLLYSLERICKRHHFSHALMGCKGAGGLYVTSVAFG